MKKVRVISVGVMFVLSLLAGRVCDGSGEADG